MTFYRDMAGVPGGVISNQMNLRGADDGSGNRATWRNKGDGFGTGCVRHSVLGKCLADGQGLDYSFTLHGSGPGSR